MGTEYGHSLSAVLAAESCGEINKVVISIQGMVSVYAEHTYANLPISVLKSWTIRDIYRMNNPIKAKQTMELRGTYEVQAIQKSIILWEEQIGIELVQWRLIHLRNTTFAMKLFDRSFT